MVIVKRKFKCQSTRDFYTAAIHPILQGFPSVRGCSSSEADLFSRSSRMLSPLFESCQPTDSRISSMSRSSFAAMLIESHKRPLLPLQSTPLSFGIGNNFHQQTACSVFHQNSERRSLLARIFQFYKYAFPQGIHYHHHLRCPFRCWRRSSSPRGERGFSRQCTES